MRAFIILLLFSTTMIGCFDALTDYDEVLLDNEFDLKINHFVFIPSKGIHIEFKNVEGDSRCPIDRICIWEGNAVVVLELKNSAGDRRMVKVNTNLDPKNAEFYETIISLRGLSPYPQSSEPINPGDYVVRLIAMNK